MMTHYCFNTSFPIDYTGPYLYLYLWFNMNTVKTYRIYKTVLRYSFASTDDEKSTDTIDSEYIWHTQLTTYFHGVPILVSWDRLRTTLLPTNATSPFLQYERNWKLQKQRSAHTSRIDMIKKFTKKSWHAALLSFFTYLHLWINLCRHHSLLFLSWNPFSLYFLWSLYSKEVYI